MTEPRLHRAEQPAVLTEAQVARYLHILRLRRQPPGLEALAELTSAHAARVPFENVSKLYRWRHEGLVGLPTIEAHLEGMERHHFGGTCYANNYYLYALLRALGYEARLCGADMRQPAVHVAIGVSLGGRDYLVDGGYAAPLLAPLPLDLPTAQVIQHGRDRYVLRPRDEAGRSRLELHRDGTLAHGYLLKPEARSIEEFEGIIARSFSPGSTFMNALMLTRYAPGRSVAIHSFSLVQVEADRTTTTPLRDRAHLIEEVNRCFGIPAPIVAEVVTGMPDLKDPWA